MREFSLEGFIAHTASMLAEVEHETHRALERAARVVEREAKAAIGDYQTDAPPFAAWAPLADGTVAEKTRLGYAPPDNPLLRTGELRDSIGHRVETGFAVGSGEAVIGSDSEVAVYQEMGTDRMPARSFLGGALVRKADEVKAIVGEGVVKALVGESIAGRLIP